MVLIRNILVIITLSISLCGNSYAVTIDIDSNNSGVPILANSFIFGDYIFELVVPNGGLYLYDHGEDYLSTSASIGKDFTLRRLDSLSFSLLSINYRSGGTSTISGVALPGTDNINWQNFSFSNEAGVTNVNSILISPSDYISIYAFEVQSVPLPPALWLFGSGLIGLIGVARRKKS